MVLPKRLSLEGTYKYAHFVFINNFTPKALKCYNFYIRFRIETIHISLELCWRDLFDGIPLEWFFQQIFHYRVNTNLHILCLSIILYQKLWNTTISTSDFGKKRFTYRWNCLDETFSMVALGNGFSRKIVPRGHIQICTFCVY